MTQPVSGDDLATILRNVHQDRPVHANEPTANAILQAVQELLEARIRIAELEAQLEAKETRGGPRPDQDPA